MTHTEYIELTELLRKLTGDADLLRIVFDTVEVPIDDPGDRRISDGITKNTVASDQAKQHPMYHQRRTILLPSAQRGVARAVEIMGGETRTGHRAKVDDPELFDVMSKFMSATSTPIPGASRLFDNLRDLCGSWFQDLNAGKMASATGKVMSEHQREVQSFKDELFASSAYRDAVDEGLITEPNIWNRSKRALVDWLMDSKLIPYKTDRNGLQHPQWSIADNVFIWHIGGKPIKDINDTAQHMPKD